MSAKTNPKAALRRHYRALRSAVSRSERQTWTAELNRHLLASDPVTRAKTVGAYLAFDGEPDLRFALTQLCRRGIRVVTPALSPETEHGLLFRPWTPATPLTTNRHGVAEPAVTAAVPLAEIDVLLIPLVAWDRDGGRLGMGAGWYDRTLEKAVDRPWRIGVGWTVQEADELPRDPWDVPLHAMATERGLLSCRPRPPTMTP